jgi:ATP-dependent Clp protease ATP-binding subunit ClpA
MPSTLTSSQRPSPSAESYDPNYGARPVERTLQRLVLSPVARMLIAEEVVRGQALAVTCSKAGGLLIQPVAAEQLRASLTASCGHGRPHQPQLT